MPDYLLIIQIMTKLTYKYFLNVVQYNSEIYIINQKKYQLLNLKP
jgi:hypothetical protein